MAFTYIADIFNGDNLIETTTSPDLKEVSTWATSNSIEGDLIVISEGYLASDGVVDKYDHIKSWYNN